jgi:hypothetical protein
LTSNHPNISLTASAEILHRKVGLRFNPTASILIQSLSPPQINWKSNFTGPKQNFRKKFYRRRQFLTRFRPKKESLSDSPLTDQLLEFFDPRPRTVFQFFKKTLHTFTHNNFFIKLIYYYIVQIQPYMNINPIPPIDYSVESSIIWRSIVNGY